MPAPKDPIKYKEWKEKVRKPLIGRPVSEKTITKLIERNKSKKGVKFSEETRRKMSLAKKGKRPWNWKGGNSPQTRAKNAPRPKPEICEVCGASGTICYDHNHKTGKFRGWICGYCNFTLGHARDSVEVLQKLIDYLNKNVCYSNAPVVKKEDGFLPL